METSFRMTHQQTWLQGATSHAASLLQEESEFFIFFLIWHIPTFSKTLLLWFVTTEAQYIDRKLTWHSRYRDIQTSGLFARKFNDVTFDPLKKLRDVTFHDPGADLSSNPKLRPATLHRHQVVGLHDTGLDALHVHGADGPQVYHLTHTRRML